MVTKQITKRSSFPTSGAEAFAELHDEIAAVSEESLIPISVDIGFAHQIPLAAADRIEGLMPELAKLPMLNIARIRKLRTYAVACQYAHLIATAPEQGDQRLAQLLEEGAKLRQDLLVTAEMLAHFGVVSEERVAEIRSGVGHVELANGIEKLGILFEEVWDRVESRIPISAEMVERAPGLAIELHALLGAKTGGPATDVSDAQSMRLRAFTLLVNVYEEVQTAVAFVRHRQGDADQLTPSIFVKQRKRTSSVEPGPPDTEEPETTTRAPTVPSTTVRPLVPSRLPITELEPTG